MHRSVLPGGLGLTLALAGLVHVLASLLPIGAAGRGEPGPVFPARVTVGDEEEDVRMLSRLGLDLDGVFDGWARVYLIAEELEKLRELGFEVAILPDPGPARAAEAEARAGSDAPAQYHTYETLTADLQQIAADHPDVARLESIGQSVLGRELWMMKVSALPDVEQDEPEFVYVAAMHGDEVVGKELTFNLIDHLTDGYGSDPRVTELVDSTEIWFLPSMNPDGTASGRRYNANWVDLNRDFPDQFVDPVNDPSGREPETQAYMTWSGDRRIALSANFHGGALVANYPFDGNESFSSVYTPSPDDGVFVSLARTYADDNPPMSTSNGSSAFDDGITNGADWYPIRGGLQDWGYVWGGDLDLTLEVSEIKWPQASQLPGFWDDNLESMLSYLERVHEGVRGIVTDAVTGLPVQAAVRVEGNDFATYTDPDVGDYHRVLLPGRYLLEVSATGYAGRLVGVTVEPGSATRADVELEPLAAELEPVAACVRRGPDCEPWLVPGEDADLDVMLRNLGSLATGIEARLEPASWFAEVFRSAADYPDLDAGQEAGSFAPHHGARVGLGAPVGHKAGFALRWTSEQGGGEAGPFFLPVDAPICETVASADVPQPVPDRETATSVLAFGSAREIQTVRVGVDVTHGYRGDLRLRVISPRGTPVLLHDRSGGSSDDIHGTYGVDLTPFEPLSRFTGEDASGDWMLEVRDGAPGNEGTLDAWNVQVCGRPFEAGAPEVRLRRVDLGASGAVTIEWWPYPGLSSYRVYRSTDPSSAASFDDVTAEDPDDGDTRFVDESPEPLLFWVVTGVGPAGEGPKGHFGE